MLHVGFTGTRHGMTPVQRDGIAMQVDGIRALRDPSITGHHGCCVGADAEFHAICRDRDLVIVGNPGPDFPEGELCARGLLFTSLRDPLPHMQRNRAIVAASDIMIAAPLEPTPQPRGGTWATIRMALKALRAGKIKALYVVGRDGELLDHKEWK